MSDFYFSSWVTVTFYVHERERIIPRPNRLSFPTAGRGWGVEGGVTAPYRCTTVDFCPGHVTFSILPYSFSSMGPDFTLSIGGTARL